MNNRQTFLAMLLITLGAFAVRVFRLGDQSLWWDEIFAIMVARMPLPDWFTFIFYQDRAQVPFYFALLSLWTNIGATEFIARFLSVLIGTLTVPAIYVFGARVGGRWVGVASAMLLALSPFHIWYSQEARVYALTALLALLSHLFLLALLRRPRALTTLALAIVNALGCYAHYLFSTLLLAQMCFMIFNRRRYPRALKHWFVANFIAAVLFLPWPLAVALTGGLAQAGIAWILPAQWYDVFLSVYDFLLGAANDPRNVLNWLAVGTLVSVALYALGAYRRDEMQRAVIDLLFFLVSDAALVCVPHFLAYSRH